MVKIRIDENEKNTYFVHLSVLANLSLCLLTANSIVVVVS